LPTWCRTETKAPDVTGRYLNAPEHAEVSCVDDKIAIQALVCHSCADQSIIE
jgi:hypothetical protein